MIKYLLLALILSTPAWADDPCVHDQVYNFMVNKVEFDNLGGFAGKFSILSAEDSKKYDQLKTQVSQEMVQVCAQVNDKTFAADLKLTKNAKKSQDLEKGLEQLRTDLACGKEDAIKNNNIAKKGTVMDLAAKQNALIGTQCSQYGQNQMACLWNLKYFAHPWKLIAGAATGPDCPPLQEDKSNSNGKPPIVPAAATTK